MVVYNREDDTAVMSIGGSTDVEEKKIFTLQITLAVVCTIILFLLLLYLIVLKRNRIRAEEWLEYHKDMLFGSTWGNMTEVEILEALVKNKSLADTLVVQ